MTQEQALQLIDNHKNRLVHPIEMLGWTWLRTIVNNIEKLEWEKALAKATNICSH